MDDHGVGSWIDRRRRSAPDRVALVHGATRRSYAELAERITRLAAGLRDVGVQRGDRVVWRGPNHPAFLEALFAAAKLGAVLAPINHRLDPTRTSELLSRYEPIIVLEHAVEPVVLLDGVRRRVVVGAPEPDDPSDYEALLRASPDEPIDEPRELDELCLLPHTSGTTGSPRGVMLTHGNVCQRRQLPSDDVSSRSPTSARRTGVNVLPALFRTGGTGVNVLPVLFKGGTVVVPTAGDPDEILRLIEEESVTVGFGNPDLLQALTRSERWSTGDLSSVRWFVTGGAPVPERLVRTYLDRGVTFLQGYGLSEAAPVVLLLDADHALQKVGSAGTPPLFVDVRIVRPDGSDCAVDETGELLVKGPNVMAGYWRDPEETRRVLGDDRWLRTGDAARVDDDGYAWIVDRMGDAYESDGRLVYPGDVERVLMAHPDVHEAGVSAGTAFVVLVPGATVEPDALLSFCRTRLASNEVPTAVVIVGQLPRNSVGKLMRRELRSEAGT